MRKVLILPIDISFNLLYTHIMNEEEKLLKTTQVLEILNISYSYLLKLVEQGELRPAMEIGKNKRKRWLASEVYGYLDRLRK